MTAARRSGRVAVALLAAVAVLVGACERGLLQPPGETSGPGSDSAAPPPDETTSEGVRIYRDLRYRTPHGPQPVDVYAPPAEEYQGPYPGIVFVHGGGWNGGSRDLLADEAVAAAEHGYIGFNIGYELDAPRDPRQVRDVRAAISQARSHAELFHLDPDRLAGWGGSAGAHLIMQAAITHREQTELRAVVGWSGPYDLARGLDLSDPRAAAVVNVYLGCDDTDSDACHRRAAAASPARHTGPGAPPVFLVNSADEIVPADQMRELAENLRTEGVRAETLLLPGSRHAAAGYGDDVTDDTLRFLDSRLAP